MATKWKKELRSGRFMRREKRVADYLHKANRVCGEGDQIRSYHVEGPKGGGRIRAANCRRDARSRIKKRKISFQANVI